MSIVKPNNGWIGVDLDGTLASYDGWKGVGHVGAPIPKMVARVKRWLSEGKDVRIFTARVWWDRRDQRSDRREEVLKNVAAIEAWCVQHIGQRLPITCEKDYSMIALWDDRSIQVIPNTGERADGCVE